MKEGLTISRSKDRVLRLEEDIEGVCLLPREKGRSTPRSLLLLLLRRLLLLRWGLIVLQRLLLLHLELLWRLQLLLRLRLHLLLLR